MKCLFSKNLEIPLKWKRLTSNDSLLWFWVPVGRLFVVATKAVVMTVVVTVAVVLDGHLDRHLDGLDHLEGDGLGDVDGHLNRLDALEGLGDGHVLDDRHLDRDLDGVGFGDELELGGDGGVLALDVGVRLRQGALPHVGV